MLVLDAEGVRFGGATWEGVSRVEVNRLGEEVALDWGDGGPHAVFCDVPRQKVFVKVVQTIEGDDLDGPGLGEEGTLRFEAGPNASGAGRATVSMTAVVTGVQYGVGRGGVSQRSVFLNAVSDTGDEDPVTVSGA